LQDRKRERRGRPEGRAPRMARVNRYHAAIDLQTDSGSRCARPEWRL